MKMSKGTLLFIKSVRPPVFGYSPVAIEYVNPPKKGQAFLFTRYGNPMNYFNCCNTSTIQKITNMDGYKILTTLNSAYVFMEGNSCDVQPVEAAKASLVKAKPATPPRSRVRRATRSEK